MSTGASRRNEITDGEAAALTYAMKNSTIDEEKLQPTLTTIANAAAFTTNQVSIIYRIISHKFELLPQ